MGSYKRTILIVDDNELNREILRDLFANDYRILESSNGKDALDLLEHRLGQIDGVLLDMQMPIMDGYTFLSVVRSNPALSQLPIIVMTASTDSGTEAECLNCGASDFVGKPFHPEVIKSRMRNAIRLRESLATLSVVEYDDLTKLYTKQAFLNHVDNLLKQNPDTRYDLIASNIASFKHLQKKYGDDKTTELLQTVGTGFSSNYFGNSITSRFYGDRFIALCEVSDNSTTGSERLDAFRRYLEQNSPMPDVSVKYAIYENVEHNITARTLCDRIFTTLDSITHRYDIDIKKYTPEFQKQIDLDLIIESEMLTALKEKQFKVYYQPKFFIKEGLDRISGAESLVRWIHPSLGFMNPGVFIPLFEKTGFISKLDMYMLDTVCNDLQKWIKNGDPVYPISVNLSRISFSLPDLAKRITEIIDSYNIPHNLIHFEVTETAFLSNDDLLKKTLHAMHNDGFIFELDDFGSGYSSLSALQSLDVDIVKLDMSIIRQDDPTSDKSILRFAHTLVRMLKVKTLQEGVETKEDLERVRALNCDYVQGYFFSKPLSADEYIDFCQKKS